MHHDLLNYHYDELGAACRLTPTTASFWRRFMIRWRTGFLMLSALFLLPAAAPAEDKVEVKVAKYTDLTDTIKKLKGKVVVVDFWADW